jgi:uncharacterized repeat protein (TIGR02543 family)
VATIYKSARRIAIAITFALLSASFTAIPANANPYDGINGDVDCLTNGSPSGFFSITNNVVTSSTNCAGQAAIPSGVLTIGTYAFYDASGLTSVLIPTSVSAIETYAFELATSLASVSISASVSSIGLRAFYQTPALASISVDASNTNYSSLSGVLFNKNKSTLIAYPGGRAGDSYVIPDGVTTIEEFAFANVPALTSVKIPKGVTSVSRYAFFESALTSVTIPEGVTSIGQYAFTNSAALTTVIIPESVASIGLYAFKGTRIGSVYFFGNAPTLVGSEVFSSTRIAKTAYIKVGAANFGAAGDTWNRLTVQIGVYVVTYQSNGGTSLSSELYGGTIEQPISPTRTGYTFEGWSATDGGSSISFPYTPTSNSDVTLFARWAAIPVTDTSTPVANTPASEGDNSAARAAADLSARTVSAKKSFSAKLLAKRVGIVIVSPRASVSIAVAKSSKRICTKSGSKLRTLKAGNCVVTFTVQEPKPKKGKKPKATKTVKTLVVQ